MDLFAGIAVSDYERVLLSPGHAGHSLVTLFLGDLDTFVDAAEARGIHPESRETYDIGVRKVIFRDPDGNELGCGGAPVEP